MATVTADAGESSRTRNVRFTLTIFAGSFLLFLVQPMLARMALPRLGGSPSVWNSAMLVYQGLLLAGYAYAHWLGRFAGRTQAAIHLGLVVLAAMMLPIGLSAAQPPATANSFVWVPWLLLISVGPLFFVISAQAPLLQRWFAMSSGGDPYPLYVASNLGSFSGLLAYPLLLEPMIGVASQSRLWTAGYVILVALIAWCALRLLPLTATPRALKQQTSPVSRSLVLKWILLAAVPSGLMLSTTLHLTTDVAPMPLLWVLPLGLYLLSFSVSFSERQGLASLCRRLAPFLLLLAVELLFQSVRIPLLVMMGVVLLNLFLVAVALHNKLFDLRPEPSQLTQFYLALAIGGMLGGLFCALIAPLMFDWTYEHLILLVAAAFLVAGHQPVEPIRRLMSRPAAPYVLVGLIAILTAVALTFGIESSGRRLVFILMVVVGVVTVGHRWLFALTIAAILLVAGGSAKIEESLTPGRLTRSYFGVMTVRDRGDARVLVHGTTNHGTQMLGSPERERMPTAYYSPLSGVGRALSLAPQLYGPKGRIAVVGLGTGALSCYAQPGQHWTYFEIDPAVAEIARDSGAFSFIRRCKPDLSIILGDARLRIAEQPAASADVLVIDAFSSDAVPMHLLTREAFSAYGRYLRPGGLILVHISNRHLDLRPVVAAAAEEQGWTAAIGNDRFQRGQRDRYVSPSIWVAMSPTASAISSLSGDGKDFWEPLERKSGFQPWTDDYGSILPLIRSLR